MKFLIAIFMLYTFAHTCEAQLFRYAQQLSGDSGQFRVGGYDSDGAQIVSIEGQSYGDSGVYRAPIRQIFQPQPRRFLYSQPAYIQPQPMMQPQFGRVFRPMFNAAGTCTNCQ